jgi:hypothetical protein
MSTQPAGLRLYTEELAPVQAKLLAEGLSTQALLDSLKVVKITTQEQFAEIASILKEVDHKVKLLDEERKVSVSPLNFEVKRINDWFRPALDGGKLIVEQLKRLMSGYLLRQKAEEQRLLREAENAAKALLATAPDITISSSGKVAGTGAALVQSFVTQADAAMPDKVEGVSDKPVWTWKISDEMLLTRAFLMPDMKAIAEHVKKHGDQNVPLGVQVEADISIRMSPRSAKK